MSDVHWIKIRTAMFDDEKIRLIETMPAADTLLLIWVKLLMLAGKINSGGGEICLSQRVVYTAEMLATVFHHKLATVKLALKTFEELGMIEIEPDKTIVITN